MQKITASLSQLRAPKRAPTDPSPVRVSVHYNDEEKAPFTQCSNAALLHNFLCEKETSCGENVIIITQSPELFLTIEKSLVTLISTGTSFRLLNFNHDLFSVNTSGARDAVRNVVLLCVVICSYERTDSLFSLTITLGGLAK